MNAGPSPDHRPTRSYQPLPIAHRHRSRKIRFASPKREALKTPPSAVTFKLTRDTRCGARVWSLRPTVRTHNESRLAACPLSRVPGRVRAPCQLNTRAGWKMCSAYAHVGRGCQQTLPVNRRNRRVRKRMRGVRPQPSGLSLHPRDISLPTGERARSARTNGTWGIPTRRETGVAVKKTRTSSWNSGGLAPRDRFEPRFTPRDVFSVTG